jgi:hypothetical protein
MFRPVQGHHQGGIYESIKLQQILLICTYVNLETLTVYSLAFESKIVRVNFLNRLSAHASPVMSKVECKTGAQTYCSSERSWLLLVRCVSTKSFHLRCLDRVRVTETISPKVL